ncbi:hypothetical protein [Persephonella sp.]
MLDKIKQAFSKEAGGNQKVILGLIAIAAAVAWVVFNTFRHEKVDVSGTDTVSPSIMQQEDTVVKEEKKKAVKKEMEEAGILYEEYTERKENPEDTYLFQGEEENQETKKLKEEVEKLKAQMEELKKQQKEQQQLQEWAYQQIAKSFDYPGKEQAATARIAANQPAVSKASYQANSADVMVLQGTVLDDVRLPINKKKFVRIQTDRGVLVVRATATPIGIEFAQKGTLYSSGRAENVIVQVEDMDGNTNLFSYVIDTKGEKVAKTAFLAFLKGFSEGMINNVVRTDTFGGTTSYVEGGLRTGASKGVSAGLDVLIKEEQGKLKQMVDTVVLLKGEPVKILIIKGVK